jgi:hypothetical protein
VDLHTHVGDLTLFPSASVYNRVTVESNGEGLCPWNRDVDDDRAHAPETSSSVARVLRRLAPVKWWPGRALLQAIGVGEL